MKSPVARSIVPLAAGAALVLSLAACGGDDSADSSGGNVSDQETTQEDSGGDADLRNGPVPDTDPMEFEAEDELPDEPGNDAPMADQISHELLGEAADYAKAYDEDATVDCPEVDFGDSEDITCDMTYFGQSLSWDVSVSSSSTFASYEYDSDNRVISQQVAEDALRFETDSEDVACELDEEYSLIARDSSDEFTCHSDGSDGAASWELSVSGYGDMTFYQQ